MHIPAAAQLNWAAFSQKLGLLLGLEDRAVRFFSNVLSPEGAISVVSGDGVLLGVASARHASTTSGKHV